MKALPEKVLYVGGFELPDRNAAAHRVLANALILKELGCEVHFVGTDAALPVNTPLKETAGTVAGFTHYRYAYPQTMAGWWRFLTQVFYMPLIDELKPDLIIAYNYPAVALYRLLKHCRKKGILLIADSTEWYALRGNIIFRILKSLDNSLRMRFVHRRLDGIVVISEYLRRFYEGAGMPVICVPPLTNPDDPKWIAAKQKPNKELKLVFAGSPGAGHKDRPDIIIRSLLEASRLSRVPFHLDVAGISADEYRKMFENDVYLPENVYFRGRISHPEVIKLVQQADFQMIIREPNIVNNAGFPTKMVESLACGTPVLANRFSNIADYLHHGQNGFILDNSSDRQLTQSLLEVFGLHRPQIEAMKNHCRNNHPFGYRHFIAHFRAFLQQITAQQRTA